MDKKLFWVNSPKKTDSLPPLPEGWTLEYVKIQEDCSKAEFLEKINSADAVRLSGFMRCRVGRWLTIRSLDCRQGFFVDFLVPAKKGWAGESLQYQVFKDVIVQGLQKLKSVGEILFLGIDESVIPLMSALHVLGARKFYFLSYTELKDDLVELIEKQSNSLIDSEVLHLKPATFVRDPRTFKIAMVGSAPLAQEWVDDLSYFHFIRADSLLVDQGGSPNFPFKVAVTLGIPVVSFEEVLKVFQSKIFTLIENCKGHSSL